MQSQLDSSSIQISCIEQPWVDEESGLRFCDKLLMKNCKKCKLDVYRWGNERWLTFKLIYQDSSLERSESPRRWAEIGQTMGGACEFAKYVMWKTLGVFLLGHSDQELFDSNCKFTWKLNRYSNPWVTTVDALASSYHINKHLSRFWEGDQNWWC